LEQLTSRDSHASHNFNALLHMAFVLPSKPSTPAKAAPAAGSAAGPDTLEVTVVRARNLVPTEGKGDKAYSSAYVVLECGKKKFQTKTVRRSLKPSYDQRYYFALPRSGGGGGGAATAASPPAAAALAVRVLHDYNLMSDVALGACAIDDVAAWCGGRPRGERSAWLPLAAPTDAKVLAGIAVQAGEVRAARRGGAPTPWW